MLFHRLTVPAFLLVSVLPCQVMAASTPTTTITGKITVTANISSSCEVTTTESDMPLTGDFGTISFDTSDWISHKKINANPLQLTVACTAGSVPEVTLNQGTSYADSSWHMVNKNSKDAKIAYHLYSDSHYSAEIKPEVNINANKENPFNMVIAGQIPSIPDAKSVTPGEYQDTIQMTVNWSGS
ncbi:spore coat protein U domain-containing protein [Yokenella regensburgei]|uniref:spore coat protein U domain-containing protein n=1 Tax=Yokenella regensburgei TaxID=158877 RepID=UPI0013760E3E|nr:spore coat protein U domain-containing protein [Yokenella regensburgei]KAF1366519.1 spore coat protein U-like protein [Yokenella regensburgei]